MEIMKTTIFSKSTAMLTVAAIVIAAGAIILFKQEGSNKNEPTNTVVTGVSAYAQAGKDALVRCGTGSTDCLDNAAVVAYKDGGAEGVSEFASAASELGGSYCNDWLIGLGSKLYTSDGVKAFSSKSDGFCRGALLVGGFVGIGETVSPAEIPKKALELCSAISKSTFACASLLSFSAMTSSQGNVKVALGFCDGLKDQGAARTCGMTLTLAQFNEIGKNKLDDCSIDMTPASAGCANYVGTLGNREGLALEKACKVFKGIVLDDCQYGFGFTAGAQQSEKIDIESVCGVSEWCTRGAAWGVSASAPTKDLSNFCDSLYDAPKIACEAGLQMKDYRDTETPNRPVPLSHDNYNEPAPKS